MLTEKMKSTIRTAAANPGVALITFIIGVVVTAMSSAGVFPKTKIMPAGNWEANIFPIIDTRTNAANLPSLRTVNLPDGDLEARVWIGFGLNGEDGFILRRSSNQWSAVYLRGFFDRYPPKIYQEQISLGAPKSGWEQTWQRLVEAGILNLPDASAIGCNPHVLDGVGYVVETNTHKTYRTYMYDNPQYAKCDEAKRVIKISEIIYDEFGLP